MTTNKSDSNRYYLALADTILKDKKIFVTDGKFLYYSDGIWHRIDGDNAIRKMRYIIEKEFKDKVDMRMALSTPTMAKKLFEAIKTSPSIREVHIELKNSSLVAIEKGKNILDLSTMQIRPIKSEDYQFWGYDFAYKPTAKWSDAPEFCKFISKSIGIDLRNGNKNDKKRKHFLETIAYLCTNAFGVKKMIVFLGPPSCGKSVLLKFLKKIIGKENFSPLSLSDLSDKFRAQLLEDVHVIINDELPCRGVRNLDILKKIISCEDIVVEKKKSTPFAFRPTVKVVFAANQLPQLREYDSGNAFAERITVLRFQQSIPRADWQLDLSERLYEERDTIVSCAIQEVRSFLANPTAFSEDEEGLAVLKEYKSENDSVNQFIHDKSSCVISSGKDDVACRVSVKTLFDEYVRYCETNAINAAVLVTFRQQMAQLGFKHHRLRYHGRSVSCFVGIGLAKDCMYDFREKEDK